MATMASTAIDTLRYARRLKDAGVSPEQAEAMADAIGSELAVQLATKADLDVAITGLDASITAMKADLDVAITGLDTRITATKADLDVAITGLDASITATRADLDIAITGLDARLNARINKIESSLALLRWMMGFTLAFVVALTWRAFA